MISREILPIACAVALLGLAFFLTGCGAPEDLQLPATIGAGLEGRDVSEATVQEIPLFNSGGQLIGSLSYDASYFAPLADEPDAVPALTLVSLEDTLSLLVLPIVGRPDTPCRFNAARLARDEEYRIKASGDRENANNLDIHQVSTAKKGSVISFYCAPLRGNSGVMIQAAALTGTVLESRQMAYLLNSIREP